jgi:hypothetical protein
MAFVRNHFSSVHQLPSLSGMPVLNFPVVTGFGLASLIRLQFTDAHKPSNHVKVTVVLRRPTPSHSLTRMEYHCYTVHSHPHLAFWIVPRSPVEVLSRLDVSAAPRTWFSYVPAHRTTHRPVLGFPIYQPTAPPIAPYLVFASSSLPHHPSSLGRSAHTTWVLAPGHIYSHKFIQYKQGNCQWKLYK